MRYTYVRQHDTTDCAAACLAMVCLHYKKEVTITRLRDMMGTDLKGTNLVGLQKAANELGFSTAAVRVDRENFLSDFSLPCISGPELRQRFARRWPELQPLTEAAFGDGPAVYYTVPGWQGSIGFIAAVHGKFCASCNRVRLTSQGFLRPCLASEAGCDLRALLRSGADDTQLLAAIRETIWAKPREHHFEDSSMPATRGMYRIGG